MIVNAQSLHNSLNIWFVSQVIALSGVNILSKEKQIHFGLSKEHEIAIFVQSG